MNQLKWGVLLSYLSMGLGVLVSLAYMPFMLRLLGQSEYGLYTLVASVVSYLHLLSFGFGSTYVRYYVRAVTTGAEDDGARLNGLFLLIFSAVAVVSAVLGVVLVLNVGAVFGTKLSVQELSTARVLTGLMAFGVTVSFPASVFSAFITANEKFVVQRLLQVVQVVVSPVLMLVVLMLGHRSIGMASVAAGIVLVTTAANVWYSVKRLRMRFSFQGIDGAMLKEIVVFSSYIFMNIVIDQANFNVDKYILGRVSGTIAVAVYGLAAQINSYYMALSTAVSGVFVPKVNRLVAATDDDAELTRLFTRVGRIQFLVLALVCSGLVVFGFPFISGWAGRDYRGAYPILLLLMVPVTVPLIQNLGIEIQRAKNLHKFRSLVYLGTATANVLATIPLSQRYGGVGAAAATAVAMVIGPGLIMNVYYHRRVGLDMRYFWSELLRFMPSLIAPSLTGVAIVSFVDLRTPLSFVSAVALYVVVYGASMWFIGMNDQERNLIRGPLQRLARRLRA